MPTPFMCHKCNAPTIKNNGICEDCDIIQFYYTENWFIADKTWSKKYDKTKNDAKRADEKIKLCNHCKLCWEYDHNATKSSHNRTKKRTIYSYYKDFPTYGKEIKTCPKCIKKLKTKEN